MSGYLLRQLLHMPDDITIVGASVPFDMGRETVEFVVEGDGLPVPDEGRPPMFVDPTVTKVTEQHIWDWRIGRNS